MRDMFIKRKSNSQVQRRWLANGITDTFVYEKDIYIGIWMNNPRNLKIKSVFHKYKPYTLNLINQISLSFKCRMIRNMYLE